MPKIIYKKNINMKKIMLAMSLCVGAAKLHTAAHDVTPQEAAMELINTMQLAVF